MDKVKIKAKRHVALRPQDSVLHGDGERTVQTFGGPATQTPRDVPELQVGFVFRVAWSNGAGYSVYAVVDNPGSGPHQFELIREVENC